MSEEKKLSKDELIKRLEVLEKLRFVGDKLSLFEHNHHKELTFKQSKSLNIIYKEIWEYSHQIGELRQLIESSAQEPSEAEVEEFVEKWIKIFLCIAQIINCEEILGQQAPKLVRDMLKEYDQLCKRRG